MSEGMAGLIAVLIWTTLIGGAVVLNGIINRGRGTSKPGAMPSTREARLRVAEARVKALNPTWEQDAPYPECFEEAQDDDL